MKKTYIHCGIAVILLLAIVFLPAGNGLTMDGVHLLAILVPTIYLWITVGTDWVSLLALGALVIVVGLASMLGILTPAAAVPSPLFFGPDHIQMKSTAKYAIVYLVIMFVALLAVVWPLASAVIKF